MDKQYYDDGMMQEFSDFSGGKKMAKYIKATINDEGSLDIELNCSSKKEAYIIAAAIAAQMIENRSDYNTFCKIVRKVLNNENSK